MIDLIVSDIYYSLLAFVLAVAIYLTFRKPASKNKIALSADRIIIYNLTSATNGNVHQLIPGWFTQMKTSLFANIILSSLPKYIRISKLCSWGHSPLAKNRHPSSPMLMRSISRLILPRPRECRFFSWTFLRSIHRTLLNLLPTSLNQHYLTIFSAQLYLVFGQVRS